MKPAPQPCQSPSGPLPGMLLSSAFLFLLLAQVLASLTPTELKNLLSEAEWNAFVGPGENEGVEVVWAEDTRGGRLELEAHGELLSLQLEPASSLLDPKFVIVSRLENSSRLLDPRLAEPSCHFASPARGALFLCGGISGIIYSAFNDSYYVINPIKSNDIKRTARSSKRPHVVVKRKTPRLPPDRITTQFRNILNLRGSFYPQFIESGQFYEESGGKLLNDQSYENSGSNQQNYQRNTIDDPVGGMRRRRKKRGSEDPPPIHVETAVFVDRDLYTHMTTNFPKNTEKEVVKFVLTMINAVQMLYHEPSLGQQVKFVVKRLEILHADPAGLTRSHDIDRFLGNFCAWQKTENPGEDSNPLHWDHALILTGLDLYVLSKNGKISKQVVGLAPVAGMCTATSSCTVNEGRHFESVYVVAHEIGHKSVS